jgi:very-short-patch-repair endonuclease
VNDRKTHPFWFTPQKICNATAEFTFFVDFYFSDCKLVVELDGKHHHYGATAEWDGWRSKLLSAHGMTVLRFDNEDIIGDVSEIVRRIIRWMQDNTYGIHRNRIINHLSAVRKHRPEFYAMLFS